MLSVAYMEFVRLTGTQETFEKSMLFEYYKQTPGASTILTVETELTGFAYLR